MAGLQFKVDGVKVGSELAAGPYTASWNTTLIANGTHTVSATARDLAGNTTTSSATVTVANVQDTTPPKLISSVPSSNGTVFPAGANIYARFSEAVDGVSASSFVLKNAATGAVVPAAVSYKLTATTSEARLDPSVNLADDTRYTLSLTGAIRDRSGNALTPVAWSFVTGPRPTATVIAPAPGATGVSRSTNVTAKASEDLSRVGLATVQLISASGVKVPAVVSFNASTNVVTFDPSAALAANTKYTARLTTGIKDLVGNPLVPLTWTFTTGA